MVCHLKNFAEESKSVDREITALWTETLNLPILETHTNLGCFTVYQRRPCAWREKNAQVKKNSKVRLTESATRNAYGEASVSYRKVKKEMFRRR